MLGAENKTFISFPYRDNWSKAEFHYCQIDSLFFAAKRKDRLTQINFYTYIIYHFVINFTYMAKISTISIRTISIEKYRITPKGIFK